MLWLVRLCALSVAVGLTPLLVCAQTSTNKGRMVIQSASLLESPVGWQLVAATEIQLSPEMRQGLNSGVPLQFIVDFRIRRARAYWLDDVVLEYQHRYNLNYYELTRHYRLQSDTTGESGNYRSLIAALDQLGSLQGVVVRKPEQFKVADNLYAQLSLRLDDNALPLPLQPLFSSTWKLASEDFVWPLN